MNKYDDVTRRKLKKPGMPLLTYKREVEKIIHELFQSGDVVEVQRRVFELGAHGMNRLIDSVGLITC